MLIVSLLILTGTALIIYAIFELAGIASEIKEHHNDESKDHEY
jgi:hypothetical protein